MMIGLVPYLVYAAALAGIQAAPPPQNAPPPDDQSTIVVTGERNHEESVRDFVGALTHASPQRQLARFEHSVCPIALGLPQLQREAVAGRMRRVAREVGLAVGGAGCVPNVVVMVTADKKALIEEIRRRYPDYFGDLSYREIRKLARQPGPSVAWQLRGTPVSASGTELAFDPAIGANVNRTIEPGSRMHSSARPQFAAAVVVVEREALAGLSVTQLADYAAMRAYSGADPARLANAGATTILRILDAPMGSAVPVTLTHWDLGFLRGFYAGPRNISNAAQRSAIRKTVARELETRPGE